MCVLLDGRLGLIGGFGGLEMHRLQALDLLLENEEPVGELLGGRRVLIDFPSIASGGGLLSHQNGLAGVGIGLLELFKRVVDAHLGLLLIGHHVGRLFAEATVLILGLGDGLFELHLGIGCLLVAQIELGQEVVPALTEIAEHDSDRRSETPRSDGDSAPERSSRRAQHHVRLPDTGAEAGDDIDKSANADRQDDGDQGRK